MITLYSTNCPQCKALEKKLNQAGIEYTVNSDLAVMKEKGFHSAPQLEVDDDVMNFSEAIRWIRSYAN